MIELCSCTGWSVRFRHDVKKDGIGQCHARFRVYVASHDLQVMQKNENGFKSLIRRLKYSKKVCTIEDNFLHRLQLYLCNTNLCHLSVWYTRPKTCLYLLDIDIVAPEANCIKLFLTVSSRQNINRLKISRARTGLKLAGC